MNKLEMARLLAKIQLGDRRQVTELVIADWMETVGHLNYQDAYQAVVNHRQNSTEYLMPAHITQQVRKTSPARAVTMSPEVSDCGRHRWFPDGTCLHCETRRDPDEP